MIAVFTRYYPHRENFDEVLELAAALARDEKRQRVGCFETRLFCDREGGEIKSVSLWENITLKCRIDTAPEIEYIENGGVLHYVLRKLAKS